MSETAEPQANAVDLAAQTALREALAQIKSPTIDGKPVDPEKFSTALDDALGIVASVAAMAKSPANSLEADLTRALLIHINAGNAASAMGALAASLDRIEAHCKGLAESAEAALNAAMAATLTDKVECDTHSASLGSPSESVEITDEKLLPLDVFDTPKRPEPKPSKKLIGDRLRAEAILKNMGHPVEAPLQGAKLVESDPGVSIRKKKEKKR